MNEKKAALARPRRLACPKQVMDPAPRYRHKLRLAGVGNGPPKPIRRRRTDRQEIDWYGFAAQGGYTRITGWVLPPIGHINIRRWTLLIPYPPVNSAISRSAVPPACSSIRRSHLGAVGPGALYPSPRRGTEGSKHERPAAA